MLEGYDKAVKKEILRLSSLAYEREMNLELAKLREHFRLWEAGKLNAFELTNLIHKYHDGTARELYKQYHSGRYADWWVARAVVLGLIKPDEVTAETMAALKPSMEQNKAMFLGDLPAPDETL